MSGWGRSLAAAAAGGLLFVLLATANAAGYRYGASDQAFHVPAVVHALQPEAFPRDAAMLDTQGRFMLFDDGVAAVVRWTGLSLETTFLLGYLGTTLLLWIGLVRMGWQLTASPWAVALLGGLLTLRHRIPRTSVNSIEPYFYPRMIAFALGVLAIGAVHRGQRSLALALVGAALMAHVTTGAWFGLLLGVALLVLDPRLRLPAAVGTLVAMTIATWAWVQGRLDTFVQRIDDVWLASMIAGKDSLFPGDWPWWAWLLNGAPVAGLLLIHRARVARGEASPADRAVMIGTCALVAMFLLTLPLVTARMALPVQLQMSRVFWIVDLIVTLYGVALLSAWARRRGPRLLPLLAGLVILLSFVRGSYVMLVERPARPLFRVGLPQTPWTEAMAWIARQPLDVHVLAHPGHAAMYGSSVRVAARRDVVHEETKDTAVALYARETALRVAERRSAIGHDFHHLSAAQVEALARTYDVDYLVTAGAPLPFPERFRNGTFRIYDVRPGRRAAGAEGR